MWVDTSDLPTSDGHPYFERLNRVLADSGFDAFVEELCGAFYADRLGRPSLRPGRYFRMLFIGYFEGLTPLYVKKCLGGLVEFEASFGTAVTETGVVVAIRTIVERCTQSRRHLR